MNLIKQNDLILKEIDSYSIIDIECYFYLLKKIPCGFEENENVMFFRDFYKKLSKKVLEEDWLKELKNDLIYYYKTQENKEIRSFLENIYNVVLELKQQNKPTNGSDLIFLMEKNQEDSNYLLNNDFIEENIEDNINELAILNHINYLKNNFGLKNIYYSNEISIKNLLKKLFYIKNSLSELALNLEVSNLKELGLFDKTIAIDISTNTKYKDNIFYIGEDSDDPMIKCYFDFFYQKLWFDEKNEDLKREFIDNFWYHLINNNPKEKEDKFNYIQLYAEYIDDCRNFIIENNLNKNKELLFIDEMLKGINGLLDQKEVLNLNEEKNHYFFNEWKTNFDKQISDYNINKMLKNNQDLKKEVYKIAILFKYIVLNQYKMSFWKDVLILEFLVDLAYKFLNEEDVEDFSIFEKFIFINMKNKKNIEKILNESQDLIFKQFLEGSYIGYINYYRSSKSNLDKMKVPYIEKESLIEKFYWDENVDLVKEIIV